MASNERGGELPSDGESRPWFPQMNGNPHALGDAGTSSDGGSAQTAARLKLELFQKLSSVVERSRSEGLTEKQIRVQLQSVAQQVSVLHPDLPWGDWEELIDGVLADAFGLGPLDAIMRDDEVTDILINGPRQIFVEKRGQLQPSRVTFRDDEHLNRILQRMVDTSGRELDPKSPMVDARLPDGSRINAVLRPPALNGPLVSIRRFGRRPLTVDDLIAKQSISPDMLVFLQACVEARQNILISGGTGSGKTTLLNCLSKYISHSERVATIEDTAELHLQQPHVVMMEVRSATAEYEEISARELLRNTLRMRPDRIIVGECRGAEALDMLQAMNTGHAGSLATIHANSARDVVSRLELMIVLGGIEIPVWGIRKQIASSINLVVQVSRLAGGLRKVTEIAEITGMEGDVVSMHNLFEYVQTGVDADGIVQGYYRSTGISPHCMPKLKASGASIPESMFEPELSMERPRPRERLSWRS